MTKDEKIKRLTVKTWAKIQQLRSMYSRSGGTNESFYKEIKSCRNITKK